MLDERTKRQLELLRNGDRDRHKNGMILLILGVVILVSAFWIRIKIEIAVAPFNTDEKLQFMLPYLLKDLVSSFFAVRIAMIAGIITCALGLREFLDRSPRALLIALAEDLERRSSAA